MTFHLRISTEQKFEAEAEPHSQVLQSSKMSQVITNPSSDVCTVLTKHSTW